MGSVLVLHIPPHFARFLCDNKSSNGNKNDVELSFLTIPSYLYMIFFALFYKENYIFIVSIDLSTINTAVAGSHWINIDNCILYLGMGRRESTLLQNGKNV